MRLWVVGSVYPFNGLTGLTSETPPTPTPSMGNWHQTPQIYVNIMSVIFGGDLLWVVLMSEWWAIDDDGLEVDYEIDEVWFFVKQNNQGSVYATVTFDQVRKLYEGINEETKNP